MKKLLLVLLVSLGLQTQAQINYCDSIEINLVSSSAWCNLETNISNFLPPTASVGYDWTLVDPTAQFNWAGWDSTATPNFLLTPNSTTNNVNPLYWNDTLVICLTILITDSMQGMGNITWNCYNSCEDTLFWNGSQWNLLSMIQQPPSITCDSITSTYSNITPNSIDVTTNSMSLGIQWPTHAWDLYEGGWNGQLTYSDTTVNTTIPLPSPNLVDTFVLCNWSDYGAFPYSCYSCDTFAWNNGNWNLLSMMQQLYPCDSLTYNTYQNQGFNIGLDLTSIISNPDSIDVWWAVCTNGLCYSGQGIISYFPQVTTLDTLKVSYDIYFYENGVLEVCTMEEWLIFDQNSFSWVLLNMIPTSINELTYETVNDNKIYDMLGREVNNVTIGTMYIKNNKKYIRVR